jgi:glyoxylate carboligase
MLTNLDDINPGVRRTVAWLRSLGFDTTDSGDGRTNVAAGIEGALEFPHVYIRVQRGADLVAEAHRLAIALQRRGVCVGPIGPDDTPCIQATYDPCDGSASIALLYVGDETPGMEARYGA